jgi:TolB-like protein
MSVLSEARTAAAVGAVAVGLLAGSFLFVVLRGGADSVPDDRLVIAVIPADSTEGSEGLIAEGVTRELTRIDPVILGVVGPATLGRREAGTIEPLALGRTFGAHLVLVIEVGESVSGSAPVRVSLQEVEGGREFWMGTYDDDLVDVRRLVRRITGDALGALSLPSPGG